jgi:hypothetical protein
MTRAEAQARLEKVLLYALKDVCDIYPVLKPNNYAQIVLFTKP